MSKMITILESRLLIWALLLLACAVCTGQSLYPSPLDVLPLNSKNQILIACSGTQEIAILDVSTTRIVDRISFPDAPLSLCSSDDDSKCFVSTRSANGKVYVLDLDRKEISASIDVGHTPTAMVRANQANKLYVCDRFSNQVSVVDLDKLKVTSFISVQREPIAAVLTADESLLFVANHLPYGPANLGNSSATVQVIDTATEQVIQTIALPNGSSGVRDMAVSPDGKFIYVTHILGHYLVPTTQLERGWMNTNALTIIDANRQAWLNTVLLDDLYLGAANPWGVMCSEDGEHLYVAASGTHEIIKIDRTGLHEKLQQVINAPQGAKSILQVQNNLSFLVGLKERIALKGNGPRNLALLGSNLYIAEYFSNSIGVLDTQSRHARSVALGGASEPDLVRRGEILFHDAKDCFQQWQSCVSCHPDARADGFNWDLLNDGMGNPKQVKSLVLSHKTPPVMISGVRPRAEVAVRAGIKYIQFAVLPEESAEAIDAYLQSLEPVPSPYLVNGKPGESAQRGKAVFEKAACSNCHSGPLFTDLKPYDLGMATGQDKGVAFDVPTLREIWRTAPYMFDGRALTLREVLVEHNPDDKHGVTSGLSDQEIADLIAYLRCL
ncbi:c-type cytochrome [candidate division KSB1 bacterium]|nr:c-type cytochrome [candidate division KSB1 bacterium]